MAWIEPKTEIAEIAAAANAIIQIVDTRLDQPADILAALTIATRGVIGNFERTGALKGTREGLLKDLVDGLNIAADIILEASAGISGRGVSSGH